MRELDEQIFIVASTEAIVIVFIYPFKQSLLMLDGDKKGDIHEAISRGFFIDVNIARLKQKTIVHHYRLCCKVDCDIAIAKIEPYYFNLTLIHLL